MRIIKETSTELVIRIVPNTFNTIFTAIWSLGFIVMPVLLLYSALSVSGNFKIECDRSIAKSVDCQFQMTPLLRLSPLKINKYSFITAIKYRDIVATDSEGNNSISHRILLITKSGESLAYKDFTYLNESIGRGNSLKLKNIINQLNIFIQTQEKSISIEENMFLLDGFHIIFFTFLVIGILVIHGLIRVENFSLNKTYGKIRGSSLSILGLWRYSFYLQEIQSVEVETIYSEDITYFISVILMNSGKRICLGFDSNRNTAVMKINRVRKFLDLPIEESF